MHPTGMHSSLHCFFFINAFETIVKQFTRIVHLRYIYFNQSLSRYSPHYFLCFLFVFYFIYFIIYSCVNSSVSPSLFLLFIIDLIYVISFYSVAQIINTLANIPGSVQVTGSTTPCSRAICKTKNETIGPTQYTKFLTFCPSEDSCGSALGNLYEQTTKNSYWVDPTLE